MTRFFASETTIRDLGDQLRGKVFVFSPSAQLWDLPEVLELTGLVDAYRTFAPQPRVVPLLPLSMLGERVDTAALGRLLCTSDFVFYDDDEPSRFAPIADRLELHSTGFASVRGPTTFHAYRVPLSGPASAESIVRIESILRTWIPWRYVLTTLRANDGQVDELVAHSRRYMPTLLGCQERSDIQLLLKHGLTARLCGGHALHALRHLLHEMTLEVRPSPRNRLALHLTHHKTHHKDQSEKSASGKRSLFSEDVTPLLRHFRGGAGPIILGSRSADAASDADALSLLDIKEFPEFFSSFTFIDLVTSFVRDRLLTDSEELHRCDRLIAVEEHVKLIGDVLHIPSLLLPTGEQHGIIEPDAGTNDPGLLEAFLATDRETILRDQQSCLRQRHMVSESWRAALTDALQAPYEDRGWVIRADAHAYGLQQQVEEHVRRADEAERRLASAGTEAARLQEEIDDLQRRYQQQEVQLAILRRELDLVFRTRSWRITAPLRAIFESVARARSTGFLRTLLLGRAWLPEPAKEALTKLASLEVAGVPQGLFVEGVALALDVRLQTRWDPDLPIASVIIPCYNYGEYVEEAIQSVLSQELQDVEIIVVDDGSTDPYTLEVLQRLDVPRTRVIRKENGGLPDARNSGISQARGKYICCLDADDTIEPTYLEKAVSLLEANSGVTFTYSWARLFGDESGIWYTEPFDIGRLLERNHITAAGVFARRAWEEVGGYRGDMRFGYEDWEFWLRLAEQGMRGQLIPEALFNHRRHGRTMTHEAQDKHQQIVEQIRRHVPSLFADPGAVSQIRRKYVDQRVRPPLLNLSEESDYRKNGTSDALLMLVPWLPSGGAELVLYQVMRGMQDSPMEHHIISTVPSDNEWHDLFYTLTKNIYHLPNFLLADAWKDFIFNYIRVKNINKVLISASEFGYTILPELKREFPNVRVYNILHNDATIGYFRHSVGYDDCIDVHVAVSATIGEKLTKIGGVDREKIQVIYNGVDVDRAFNPTNYNSAAIRRKLGLPAKKVISFIGRLSAEKRPLEFLRIASELQHQMDAHFVLVGSGPQAAEVEAAIVKLDLRERVTWYKGLPPDKIPEILAITTVLAVTSAAEGFPFVVLEALAMGVPVISYDVGEVHSAVVSGINGLIVQPNATDEFTAALDGLLHDPDLLARLQERTRNTLVQRGFTLDMMVERYRYLLTAPLGTRPGVAQSSAGNVWVLGSE